METFENPTSRSDTTVRLAREAGRAWATPTADVHVITVVNVHPEKDPSASQLKRAKVVTVEHHDASESQSIALDRAPRSWPHKTIIRHTVNGVDV